MSRENEKASLFERYVSTGQAGSVAATLDATRRPYLDWLIRTFVPKDLNTRILDLGAGYGVLVHHLAQQGYVNAVGVEISSEQVARAISLGVVNVEHGDLFTYGASVATQSVDVVFLMDILEHLAVDRCIAALVLARRILRPKGVCIMQVPNGEGVLSGGVLWGDLTHEQAFTSSSMRQACLAAGFSGVRVLELPPRSSGLKGSIRRIVWEMLLAPRRLLSWIETGQRKSVLSRNLLAVASQGNE